MANLAFNAAQCIDPTYTQAWIGQATIAEMYALPEAMDLYRHSSELGAHVCLNVMNAHARYDVARHAGKFAKFVKDKD